MLCYGANDVFFQDTITGVPVSHIAFCAGKTPQRQNCAKRRTFVLMKLSFEGNYTGVPVSQSIHIVCQCVSSRCTEQSSDTWNCCLFCPHWKYLRCLLKVEPKPTSIVGFVFGWKRSGRFEWPVAVVVVLVKLSSLWASQMYGTPPCWTWHRGLDAD